MNFTLNIYTYFIIGIVFFLITLVLIVIFLTNKKHKQQNNNNNNDYNIKISGILATNRIVEEAISLSSIDVYQMNVDLRIDLRSSIRAIELSDNSSLNKNTSIHLIQCLANRTVVYTPDEIIKAKEIILDTINMKR